MTKKEIVKQISEEVDLTQLKTKQIVQKTFDAIVETLVTDKRIELRNFGVFEVKKRAARKARNPRTGDQVDVAEKYVVTFKPGKEMEERVRLLDEEEAARAQAALSPEPASGQAPRPVSLGTVPPPPASPVDSRPPSPPEHRPGENSSDSSTASGNSQHTGYGSFGHRPGE